MPIYEYGCTVCGRAIDVVHGIHADGPTVCATCGGAMKKLLSAPAIHFKGSGWAKKDARSAAAPAASSVKKEGTPASSDPGSDSAPAAPAATPAPATPAAPSTTGTATGSTTTGSTTTGS